MAVLGRIECDKITYCKGDINYTTINFSDGGRVMVGYHVGKIGERFGLIRVSKSIWVNEKFAENKDKRAIVGNDSFVFSRREWKRYCSNRSQ